MWSRPSRACPPHPEAPPTPKRTDKMSTVKIIEEIFMSNDQLVEVIDEAFDQGWTRIVSITKQTRTFNSFLAIIVLTKDGEK